MPLRFLPVFIALGPWPPLLLPSSSFCTDCRATLSTTISGCTSISPPPSALCKAKKTNRETSRTYLIDDSRSCLSCPTSLGVHGQTPRTSLAVCHCASGLPLPPVSGHCEPLQLPSAPPPGGRVLVSHRQHLGQRSTGTQFCGQSHLRSGPLARPDRQQHPLQDGTHEGNHNGKQGHIALAPSALSWLPAASCTGRPTCVERCAGCY